MQVEQHPVTLGLDEFLGEQPFISIKPSHENYLLLEGEFRFTADHEGLPRITDSYRLRISVPASFPRDVPSVSEIGGKIPRSPHYHVNADGTLCLGSPIRVMTTLMAEPTIPGFSRRCIIPYLYAMTAKLHEGGAFIFGELSHGTPGEMEDYKVLLGLQRSDQVPQAIRCLLKKKRIANKMICPCGCHRRLGRCRFNQTIKQFRHLLPRAWLKATFSPDKLKT